MFHGVLPRKYLAGVHKSREAVQRFFEKELAKQASASERF